jgi:hypothetical protein
MAVKNSIVVNCAMLVQADEPGVVKRSRLEAREPANALLSTLAFPDAD